MTEVNLHVDFQQRMICCYVRKVDDGSHRSSPCFCLLTKRSNALTVSFWEMVDSSARGRVVKRQKRGAGLGFRGG